MKKHIITKNILKQLSVGSMCKITIYGNSMYPTLKDGDIAIVKKMNPDEYKKDDIVVFCHHHLMIVHRIIVCNYDQVITKGDAINKPDKCIKLNDIYGKIIL